MGPQLRRGGKVEMQEATKSFLRSNWMVQLEKNWREGKGGASKE